MRVAHLFRSLKRRFVFKLSSENHPLFLGFYRYIYRPRAGSINYYLDKLSRDKKDFFVFQVGANDGITHDPIHKFIKRDHWQGVLLEPQSQVFINNLLPLYRNQSGIVPIHAALGKIDGEANLYGIAFSSDRWATGLASFDRSVLEKSFTSGHVLRQAKKQNISIPTNSDDWIRVQKVPVVSVTTILMKYNISKIDLLQIDTEGFDFEIIKMFDFNQIRPDAISYEHMHFSPIEKAECEAFLLSAGYQIKVFNGNTLALSTEIP